MVHASGESRPQRPLWLVAGLWLVAIATLSIGGYGLVEPRSVGELAHLEPASSAGVGELRAIYGGLLLAIGSLMVFVALGRADRSVARVLAWCFWGFALGRLLSLIVEGTHSYTWGTLAFESVTAALLMLATRFPARPHQP